MERWAAEQAGDWRLHFWSGSGGPWLIHCILAIDFLMNRSHVHLLGSGGRPKQEARIGLKLSRIIRRPPTKIYNPRASTWAHQHKHNLESGDGLGVKRWLFGGMHASKSATSFISFPSLPSPMHP